MKTINFVIFFSIFLAVYGLVHLYIFIRGWQAIPKTPLFKYGYMIIFLFLAMSFIAGRVLEKAAICRLSTALIWTGSLWLAFFFYFFLSVVVIDIFRLANHFGGLIDFTAYDYPKIKIYLLAAVAGISTVAIFAGFINAATPRVKTLCIDIPKKAGGIKTLNIALATDIHLGVLIRNSRLNRMVGMINGLNPDIVLLCGDIVDEDIAPVIKNNLGEKLKSIRSKYGTYAVTGNHEYIGGADGACAYLADHGVQFLRDRCVKIDESFYLAGRDDRSLNRFNGKSRKDLKEILAGADRSLPLILMDHQPFFLSEAAESGIDLQLSGHTHNGQIWPANVIVNLIYELGHGYRKTGATHYYVSEGYGTWGPPVRIGSRPEVVYLRVRFL